MNIPDMQFDFDKQLNAWKSRSKVRFLNDELEIWLSAENEADFNDQEQIFSKAVEILPHREAEAMQLLYDAYQEACVDFSDLVGTDFLPLINSPEHIHGVFRFSVLEVPEQLPNRGTTFKIVGGCSWNENDGFQIFFRDFKIEHVDSDAALYW